ncbi:hypothetical protein [Microlunatus ginsengisoli]|uniref:hypothetical protein n=1 Tax=Microlunatus ginsengisoli TaxID=363863 RepID=UPI0031CFE35F
MTAPTVPGSPRDRPAPPPRRPARPPADRPAPPPTQPVGVPPTEAPASWRSTDLAEDEAAGGEDTAPARVMNPVGKTTALKPTRTKPS